VSVKARVTKVGRSITFLEAELFDRRGKLSARATASAALVSGVFDEPKEALNG
jgi:acyl-coenzyme A thioesterase PaaI-like protein